MFVGVGAAVGVTVAAAVSAGAAVAAGAVVPSTLAVAAGCGAGAQALNTPLAPAPTPTAIATRMNWRRLVPLLVRFRVPFSCFSLPRPIMTHLQNLYLHSPV